MQFLTIIALVFASALSLVFAARFDHAAVDTVAQPRHPLFYLTSHVMPDQSADKDRFNGLYLSTYHTGAGLNDVVLSTKENSQLLYEDGSHILFSLSNIVQYPISLELDNIYYNWGRVSANGNDFSDQNTFAFQHDDLVIENSPGAITQWTGWRVCDFWLGVPQLFWDVGNTTQVPCGCAKITLCKVKLG